MVLTTLDRKLLFEQVSTLVPDTDGVHDTNWRADADVRDSEGGKRDQNCDDRSVSYACNSKFSRSDNTTVQSRKSSYAADPMNHALHRRCKWRGGER